MIVQFQIFFGSELYYNTILHGKKMSCALRYNVRNITEKIVSI